MAGKLVAKWVGHGREGSMRVIDHVRADPRDRLVYEVERRAMRKLCDWDRILAVNYGQESQG